MVSWVEVKWRGPHGRRSRVESLINTHGRPLHVSVPQKLADGPQRFVAFPQHPQRAEPDLGRGWFGVFGTLEHKHDELIFAVSFQPTASVSLVLKNSMLAKKMGEGILKIFTPSGSFIWDGNGTERKTNLKTCIVMSVRANGTSRTYLFSYLYIYLIKCITKHTIDSLVNTLIHHY